jgi:hypothetical protein
MFTSAPSGVRVIMAKPLGSSSLDSYAMWWNNNNINCIVSSTTTNAILGAPLIPVIGQWYHVASSFDDATKQLSLYLNGALVASGYTNFSISYDTKPFVIGCDIESNVVQYFFNGRIDEAAIYNRSLSAGEVASIYNAGIAGKTTAGPIINTPSALPDGFVGQAYSQAITALRTTGSTSYSVTGGTLPPGLSLNGAGVLSGTPTTVGSYSFTIRITDSSGFSEQPFTLQVYAPLPPPSGLVSWWRAENNALDSIGSNHGTLQGGAGFATGKVGQAFNFIPSNQNVLVPNSVSLQPQTLSVEAWVYPRTVGDFNDSFGGVIFSKDRGSASGAPTSYALFGLGNTGKFTAQVEFTDSTLARIQSVSTFSFGQWYHVAMTWDGSRLNLYVNGNLEGSAPAGPKTIVYTSDNAGIGRHSFAARSSNARIDEVAIYDRALAAVEIGSLFNAGSAGKTVTGPYFNVPPTLPEAVVSTPYSQTITTLRGTAPISYSVIGGSLPPGLTLNSSGLLSGTPTTAGSFSFIVRATDANSLTGDQTFTLQVLPRVYPPAGIISWWRAENNAQDSIAANNGTLTNGATFAAGKVGTAFSFDGVDDLVTTPSINVGSKFTVEFWLFPTRSFGYEHLISNNGGSTNYGDLYFRDDHIEYWQASGAKAVTATGTVPLYAWSHIALTYDNGIDLIYVNGVPLAFSGSHTESFNNPLAFGYTNAASNNHLKGSLDEIALYNRALTTTEISALYAAGSAGKTTDGPYINTPPQLPDGGVGQSYSQTITSLRGTGTVTYALVSGALPPGLTLASNGVLSGTPTVAGTSTFIIRATDASSLFGDETFTLRVFSPFRIPTGLISWWRAENNALDSIGTNNGTLTNGATFGAGKAGQAFLFDGINDYLNVPDAASLRPSSLSVEAWVLFSATPTGVRSIIAKPLGSGSLDSYAIYIDNGNLKAVIADTGGLGSILSYPFSPILGRWYHFAYTLDDANNRQALYVDGLEVVSGTETKSPSYDTRPFILGADIEGGGLSYFFAGEIDEAALYNRALTAQEVYGIHSASGAGKRFFFPFETWKLTNLGNADAPASGNPDGDSLVNLLEYAFNSNPNSSASSNVPTVALDATYLSITYTKVLAATDLTYSIEQCTDLASSPWQPVTPINQILFDNGTVQTIKAQVPRSNAVAGRLFLRMRVTVANQ